MEHICIIPKPLEEKHSENRSQYDARKNTPSQKLKICSNTMFWLLFKGSLIKNHAWSLLLFSLPSFREEISKKDITPLQSESFGL